MLRSTIPNARSPVSLDARTLFTPLDGCPDGLATALTAQLAQDFGGLPVLKAARQRRVLRMPFEDGSVIVKLFPLRNPSSRLRYRKYALAETINYVQAQARGVPTPQCHGYLERRSFGFVNLAGLVIGDLADHEDALQISRSLGYAKAAAQCIPALCTLFETGTNHIDARDENIMFSNDTYRLIDWQYASFVPPRSPWLLEHLAAYFIRKAPEAEKSHLLGAWLSELHATATHPAPEPLFRQSVTTLLANRQGTRARLALRPAKRNSAA